MIFIVSHKWYQGMSAEWFIKEEFFFLRLEMVTVRERKKQKEEKTSCMVKKKGI